MNYTYNEVKQHLWDVIKDKTDLVYEPSSECDTCINHSDWEYDPDEFDDEPPACDVHYEHDACRYFYAHQEYGSSDYDTPACVVGNWFVFEKFSPEDLNVSSWEELEGNGVRTILEESNLEVSDEAKEFLNYLQTYQDTGVSWGNAYEMAVAKLEGNDE